MNDTPDDDGRLELYRADGRVWFRLVWRDQMLLRSNGEATRDEALANVDRLRSSSTSMRGCMSASGRFYFMAKSAEGVVLAKSGMFEVPAERDAAMVVAARLVQSDVMELRVVDALLPEASPTSRRPAAARAAAVAGEATTAATREATAGETTATGTSTAAAEQGRQEEQRELGTGEQEDQEREPDDAHHDRGAPPGSSSSSGGPRTGSRPRAGHPVGPRSRRRSLRRPNESRRRNRC